MIQGQQISVTISIHFAAVAGGCGGDEKKISRGTRSAVRLTPDKVRLTPDKVRLAPDKKLKLK